MGPALEEFCGGMMMRGAAVVGDHVEFALGITMGPAPEEFPMRASGCLLIGRGTISGDCVEFGIPPGLLAPLTVACCRAPFAVRFALGLMTSDTVSKSLFVSFPNACIEQSEDDSLS